MWGLGQSASFAPKDFTDCSGCSLCLLVCPVWRQTRDVGMTPHGRAKAMQHEVAIEEIAASFDSCTLCMACDHVCPENIDLSGMVLDMRRQGASTIALHERQARVFARASSSTTHTPTSSALLLPDAMLRASSDLLTRVAGLLGGNRQQLSISKDDGADIALALEAGVDIDENRLQRFLMPLRRVNNVIVTDALLLRLLRKHLPGLCVVSLGEALSGLASVRCGLLTTDMYVIEPRAYHSDYQRLVIYYDRLRGECGCAFNLDLQRIVIPATARSLPQRLGLSVTDDGQQTRWLLKGRDIRRIVVESLEDRAAFENVTDIPVLHLAELNNDM